jgi:hypothetical protein
VVFGLCHSQSDHQKTRVPLDVKQLEQPVLQARNNNRALEYGAERGLKSSQIFAAMVILAVGTVVWVNAQPYVRGPTAPSSPSGTYVNSVNGLRLLLSINATVLTGDQRLLIQASELNTMLSPNNVTRAEAWGVSGLGIGACFASVYPFGVAVFQGRYDAGNITQAKPIRIYPVVACPMLIRLVTGYLFEANSSNAVVLPGTGPAIPMRANVTLYGRYLGNFSGSPLAGGATPFAPGTYTVVAGDEWGALAFLYFRVK